MDFHGPLHDRIHRAPALRAAGLALRLKLLRLHRSGRDSAELYQSFHLNELRHGDPRSAAPARVPRVEAGAFP
jgi:hypothetical protein